MASRLAWGFVSSASVTTTASVVFSTDVAAAPPLMRMLSMSGVNAGGNPRPPYSRSISNGAAQNIEHDRAGHDRNHRATHRKAAALLGEPGLHSAAGLEPERRAAREHQGIDPLHGVGEVEQRVLAGAGTAAAHVDRRHRRL